VGDPLAYSIRMVDNVRSMASEFDILHFHTECFHFPIFRDIGHRTITTLHGRQDRPELKHICAEFPVMPLVSVSHSQRAPVADANFVGTIPHGVPIDLLTPTLRPLGGYLAFLGRISPEKRVDRAIAIARAVGLPLKIAAKVDRTDKLYFHSKIEPLLKQPGIEFTGEVDDRCKATFLGNALALLFPIDWPEPFGLVMIEAMACGTPVLAFRRGAVPEVVDEGITGHIVSTCEEAVCRIGSLLALDRGRIRRRFETRFAASRMARDYIGVYHDLLMRPLHTNNGSLKREGAQHERAYSPSEP
jgi:glycosyltransferase involved in cell wall biosynthesis